MQTILHASARDVWDPGALSLRLTNCRGGGELLKPGAWVWVRFSRHAKNEMRLYGISSADIESIVRFHARTEVDERGNPRLAGLDGGGRAIIVVIADDDPGFVITTFPDD